MWQKVCDSGVRHVWTCMEKDCEDHGSAVVGPDWYEQNGTPVCTGCDCDMSYTSTAVFTLGIAAALERVHSLACAMYLDHRDDTVQGHDHDITFQALGMVQALSERLREDDYAL